MRAARRAFVVGEGENFAAEAGATAYVEDERGGCEVQEGKSAVGHVGLDLLYAGAGGVLSGFSVIVEEVGRPGLLSVWSL